MRRLGIWGILSQIKPGFYLLLIASALLFAGAIIADLHSDNFRILNFMLLWEWLVSFRDRPILYVWMFILFAVLFMLTINTCFCTWIYIKNTVQSGVTVKKAGIVLFHLSFLLFLAGHLVYECTGSVKTVILEQGVVSQQSGEWLWLEPVTIKQMYKDVTGKQVRMGTRTSIIIKDSADRISTIHPESMKPALSSGYSFHIGMNKKGLSDEQVRLIIRKSPAIYIFIVGAIGIVIAFFLLFCGTKPSRSRLMAKFPRSI